jgi:hypothetical protein
MNARAKRASRRQISRAQASPTAGRVTRTMQEAINTGEAISIGAVNLVTNTALAALSGAQDVGAEAGSVAVAALRGAIVAATEIGGDLGRVSGRVLNGTLGAAREIGSDLMNLVNTGVRRDHWQRQQVGAVAASATASAPGDPPSLATPAW